MQGRAGPMVLSRFIDILIALGVAGWIMAAGMMGDARAAAYDTSRLDRMPDFTQTDGRLGLPGGGKYYCVPVATANVLVWLAEHRGYTNLLPVRGLSTIEKVATVAGRLGSDRFMSTAPKGGTSPQRFIDGLMAYINEAGYSGSIETYGRWRFSGTSRSHTGAPDMYDVRSRFAGGAGVWVSVGFYRQGNSPGELVRVGGHMATMAGFGVAEDGGTDREIIILHDPDDGHSQNVQRRYLRPEAVRNAYFTDYGRGRSMRADDFLDVTESWGIPASSGVRAVIDGIYILDM